MQKDNLPKINVIIPVYKAERFIAQTLNSVLSQPYPNIQIICVDDGSPDNSISILKEYAAKFSNIHIIRQKNAGVSAARNKGIEYVLGEGDGYLAFLDADDCWARDVISEELVKKFKGMDCIGLTSVNCSENLVYANMKKSLNEQEFSGGTKVLQCHQFHFGAMLYSSLLLRKFEIRFLEGLKYSEDLLFRFTCLYLSEKIKLIDHVLYLYRDNPLGAMGIRRYGIEYMPAIIEAYLQTAAFLRKFESKEKGRLAFFDVMPGVYTMEMASEHYQEFRAKKELEGFLRDNPHMTNLVYQLKDNDLSDEHKLLRNLYLYQPAKFRYLCYMKGVIRKTYHFLLQYKLIRKLVIMKNYPLKNDYI